MTNTTTYEVVIPNNVSATDVHRALKDRMPQYQIEVKQVERTPLDREIEEQVRNKILFGA